MSDGSDIEPYDHQIDSKYFGKLQDKVKLVIIIFIINAENSDYNGKGVIITIITQILF